MHGSYFWPWLPPARLTNLMTNTNLVLYAISTAISAYLGLASLFPVFYCSAPALLLLVQYRVLGMTKPSKPPQGVPTTAYDTVDPARLLGVAGFRDQLVNKQGLVLQSYFWPAPEPRAVLLYVHGHGGHMLFEMLKTVSSTPAGTGMSGLSLFWTSINLTVSVVPMLQQSGSLPQYEGSWAQSLNNAGISLCGIDNQVDVEGP